jgi:hypothetical protein
MGFADVIAGWREYGVFEFFLPFLLMFAIFYGLLRKAKLFGDENDKQVKKINLIVAGVAALFVMVYTPTGISLTAFFANFFTQTMVVLSSILSFALILYMLVPTDALQGLLSSPRYAGILALAAVFIVLLVFVAAGGLKIFGIDIGSPGMPGTIIWPTINISSEDVALLLMVLGFFFVVWFISKDSDGKKSGQAPQKGGLGGFEAGGYRFPGSG